MTAGQYVTGNTALNHHDEQQQQQHHNRHHHHHHHHSNSLNSMNQSSNSNSGTRWSGMETAGMREAKCSLLLQDEMDFDARIKSLPKQRVMVYQDKGFNPATVGNLSCDASNSSTSSNGSHYHHHNEIEDNFYVDFKGATILQLEPVVGAGPQKSMPVTITVGGRCVFTPENYQDFRVMMRTKEQSQEMDIAPNGNFDWPDVSSLLLCPVCGQQGAIPRLGDRMEHEYWMVFYPLLQLTIMKGSQMTLGTRTICRLVCLNCMDDLLDGLTLRIQPGISKKEISDVQNCGGGGKSNNKRNNGRLTFTLPASDVLAEAGSAAFLEDGPPRPETHPHVDDIMDAWTLYNLWEHSGAWEALQNDYRVVLSRSMHADPAEIDDELNAGEPRLKERMGKSCGYRACGRIHGRPDTQTGEITRLVFKCRDCHGEYYCSKMCRERAKTDHVEACLERQRDREERREKRAKKVQCDTCEKKFAFTKMKKCSRCRKATYCSVDCQRIDWERHKFVCR